MDVVENHSQSASAAFIRKHAAPGRVGLCGGRDWINKAIRKAQAPLTNDGHRSLRYFEPAPFRPRSQRVARHAGRGPTLSIRRHG